MYSQQDVFLKTTNGCGIFCESCRTISVTWTGNCLNGLGNGYGDLTYYDEKGNSIVVFIGTLLNGKAHGKGIIKYSDGGKYEGDFVAGKRTGKGIVFLSDGSKYEGDFVDDNLRQGTFYLPQEKGFIKGEFDGVDKLLKGIKFFKFSNIKIPTTYEGTFKNNKLEGYGEHCFACKQDYVIGYNWVKCWERGEFRLGQLYNGTSYEPVKNQYGTEVGLGYFTYSNGSKTKVEREIETSTSSSSSEYTIISGDESVFKVEVESTRVPTINILESCLLSCLCSENYLVEIRDSYGEVLAKYDNYNYDSYTISNYDSFPLSVKISYYDSACSSGKYHSVDMKIQNKNKGYTIYLKS